MPNPSTYPRPAFRSLLHARPRLADRRLPSPWFFLLAGLLSAYALWGVRWVPYHPDESTTLFMSGDFETWWTRPLSLAWTPGQEIDWKVHYRMMDAPLSRHVIGLARRLAGFAAPIADWNWGKSWADNVAAGALPDPAMLMAGRIAETLLLPLSLLFIYLTGRQLAGEAGGLLAALLLGTNALVLLHTRRSMAEGSLLLGVCFALWSFTQADKRPWLAGLGLALAFNSKQSALALLPAALLAVAWTPALLTESARRSAGSITAARKLLTGWVWMAVVFMLITVLLNPFVWRQPIHAVRTALQRRTDLLEQQVKDSLWLAPEKVAEGYAERTAFLLVNLFIAPPSFAEYGNYSVQTRASEQIYMATPGHNLLRGLAGGGLILGLTVLGMALSLLDLRRAGAQKRRVLILVWLATVCQAGALLLVPLAWQRYVIPLVPMVCLWTAYAGAMAVSLRNRTAFICYNWHKT